MDYANTIYFTTVVPLIKVPAPEHEPKKAAANSAAAATQGGAMPSWSGGSRAARACLIAPATIAITIAMMLVLTESTAVAQTAANPIEILFLGNSFTHGKYPPALNYNAGPGNSTDSNVVHDLLCPSLTPSGACTSGAGRSP